MRFARRRTREDRKDGRGEKQWRVISGERGRRGGGSGDGRRDCLNRGLGGFRGLEAGCWAIREGRKIGRQEGWKGGKAVESGEWRERKTRGRVGGWEEGLSESRIRRI
ncbi:MAG: hypothetical protein OXN17_07825, partial [Candidatus Poribacteria bacterium]|nr:hypothetical protein [Candidatus Poribacteria bacterium]